MRQQIFDCAANLLLEYAHCPLIQHGLIDEKAPNLFPSNGFGFPFVRVANSEGGVSIKPASPFAAAMFIKRDKLRGGVFWSPSNQDVKGILGTARPISYFDGEIDHEANRLNQADIATFIPARLSQNSQGQIAANGGNHTTSSDPLWRFVNVVRTRAVLEKNIINSFRPWANDENLTGQHVIAITRSLTSFLYDLIARGALLGGGFGLTAI